MPDARLNQQCHVPEPIQFQPLTLPPPHRRRERIVLPVQQHDPHGLLDLVQVAVPLVNRRLDGDRVFEVLVKVVAGNRKTPAKNLRVRAKNARRVAPAVRKPRRIDAIVIDAVPLLQIINRVEPKPGGHRAPIPLLARNEDQFVPGDNGKPFRRELRNPRPHQNPVWRAPVIRLRHISRERLPGNVVIPVMRRPVIPLGGVRCLIAPRPPPRVNFHPDRHHLRQRQRTALREGEVQMAHGFRGPGHRKLQCPKPSHEHEDPGKTADRRSHHRLDALPGRQVDREKPVFAERCRIPPRRKATMFGLRSRQNGRRAGLGRTWVATVPTTSTEVSGNDTLDLSPGTLKYVDDSMGVPLVKYVEVARCLVTARC